MNHIQSVASKELRAFFRSPVAIIFLGVYLAFTLVTFFGVEQFFARNIADLRPLFSWLPVLLVFLCSALTMRQWSEEQKLGTLEVLFTLPVRIPQLVLGKFIAAITLVKIALLLTIPIPLMVAASGDLDWGPVIGGYIGAALLAGAYISIGLFISALTDNQIVSLIGSVVVCGLLWLVGSDHVVQFFGNTSAEILSSIGTGSRFESIRRGVLDLRDFAYYFTLMASFLTLNSVVLAAKGWSEGRRTASIRNNARISAGLVAVNALLLNFVLVSFTSLRVDLTERGEFSISDVTKNMIRNLPEPLLIRGYLSETTHPLLAPMVPRIRDVIEEYGIIGGDLVRTEYVDPRTDPEVEKEANQLYSIKSFPFRVPDSRDRRVVNSYFSILVKYGDQFEVLNFDDLIEVQGTNMRSIEVKLRNLEYDLTSSIKRVAFSFQTLDAVFAKLDQPAEFTAFVTPDTLPENFKDVPDKIKKVLEEL
ncbi:MAG: Gldg family protein, partial [Myxococcales bacterium]|nr:Gldg family protein [Myxococcales bacterium]